MVLEELKSFISSLRYKKISYEVLAEKLGIATGTFSNKINNKNNQEFTHTEIILLKEALNLSNDDVVKYFFN
jgi:transcriptional regulator with XRE-family HTH domain